MGIPCHVAGHGRNRWSRDLMAWSREPSRDLTILPRAASRERSHGTPCGVPLLGGSVRGPTYLPNCAAFVPTISGDLPPGTPVWTVTFEWMEKILPYPSIPPQHRRMDGEGGREDGCSNARMVWVTKSSRFLLIEKRYFTFAQTHNV